MSINEEKLVQTIATVLKVDASRIGPDSSMDTIEEWDSLKHLNLVLALEDVFGISFTEVETMEIINYDLIKLVLTDHGINF